MAALHPYEQAYFNALVDTKTPGALGKRYDMGASATGIRQLLEHLLARYPDDTLRVYPKRDWYLEILPQEDRDRLITLDNPLAADFYLLTDRIADQLLRKPWRAASYYLHPRIDLMGIPDQPPLHSIRAYGSAIAYTVAKDVDAYHAAYNDVAAYGTPLTRSTFDIYAYDDALYYLSADCPPPMSNAAADWVFLHFFPSDLANLPAGSHERGFENRDFRFNDRAAFFDGKCMGRRPLPDYAVERIETGAHMNGELIWRTDISLAAQALYESIAAGDYGKPVAQSGFDLYLSGNRLAYLKEPCAAGDADAWTFLHIIPANPADLPADRLEYGFANLDFRFDERGADIVGKCVAARDLPDYPIARIRTGQNAAASGGDEWRVDIDLAARALYDSIAAGDYGAPVAQSRFNLYLSGNTLAYIKSPCAESDTDARFFLHITPADPTNLPAANRERGFANLDFHFADHGAYAGNKCVATRDLPDYSIERIRTGQFVSGAGQLWSAEFPVGR